MMKASCSSLLAPNPSLPQMPLIKFEPSFKSSFQDVLLRPPKIGPLRLKSKDAWKSRNYTLASSLIKELPQTATREYPKHFSPTLLPSLPDKPHSTFLDSFLGGKNKQQNRIPKSSRSPLDLSTSDGSLKCVVSSQYTHAETTRISIHQELSAIHSPLKHEPRHSNSVQRVVRKSQSMESQQWFRLLEAKLFEMNRHMVKLKHKETRSINLGFVRCLCELAQMMQESDEPTIRKLSVQNATSYSRVIKLLKLIKQAKQNPQALLQQILKHQKPQNDGRVGLSSDNMSQGSTLAHIKQEDREQEEQAQKQLQNMRIKTQQLEYLENQVLAASTLLPQSVQDKSEILTKKYSPMKKISRNALQPLKQPTNANLSSETQRFPRLLKSRQPASPTNTNQQQNKISAQKKQPFVAKKPKGVKLKTKKKEKIVQDSKPEVQVKQTSSSKSSDSEQKDIQNVDLRLIQEAELLLRRKRQGHNVKELKIKYRQSADFKPGPEECQEQQLDPKQIRSRLYSICKQVKMDDLPTDSLLYNYCQQFVLREETLKAKIQTAATNSSTPSTGPALSNLDWVDQLADQQKRYPELAVAIAISAGETSEEDDSDYYAEDSKYYRTRKNNQAEILKRLQEEEARARQQEEMRKRAFKQLISLVPPQDSSLEQSAL